MRKIAILLFAVSIPLICEARRFKILLIERPVAEQTAVERVASDVRCKNPDFVVITQVENTPQENRSAQLAGACEMHVVFGVIKQTPQRCSGTAILSKHSFDRSENQRDRGRLVVVSKPRNAEDIEIAVVDGAVSVSFDCRIISTKSNAKNAYKIIKFKTR